MEACREGASALSAKSLLQCYKQAGFGLVSDSNCPDKTKACLMSTPFCL